MAAYCSVCSLCVVVPRCVHMDGLKAEDKFPPIACSVCVCMCVGLIKRYLSVTRYLLFAISKNISIILYSVSNYRSFQLILTHGSRAGWYGKKSYHVNFFQISRHRKISWYNLNNQKITFLHICVYVQCFSDVQTLKTDFYLLVQSSCATALYL